MDPKKAAASHRKIVMKGCSKPWVHAIRQIVSNREAMQTKDESESFTDHNVENI